MKRGLSNKTNVAAGLLSAIAASLCCIAPLLGILGGVSGFASFFSWMEPLRPYLIGITLIIFGLAWYRQLRPQKKDSCECETGKKKSFWHSPVFLGVVTIIAALLMTFPYYASALYPKTPSLGTIHVPQNQTETIIFKIRGMTCESCTKEVNSQLAAVPGVISFQTSLKKAQTEVRFNRTLSGEDRIRKAINNSGYQVVSTQH